MLQTYNSKQHLTLRRNLRKNQTDAEKTLWNYLRNKQLGVKFQRQYSVDKYILDFYCPSQRLAIELDGGQHNQIYHQLRDTNRTKYLESQNIQVLRYWNNQVLVNTQAVLEDIHNHLTF